MGFLDAILGELRNAGFVQSRKGKDGGSEGTDNDYATRSMDGFGPKEFAALGHMQWFQSVGGYNTMNGSRPQTVASTGVRRKASPAHGEVYVGRLGEQLIRLPRGSGSTLATCKP